MRIPREAQTTTLIEKVERGEISTSQFEQLSGFLAAERLGLTDRAYKPETARRRRSLAHELGIAPTDADDHPLDVGLDELMEVPRSAWPVEVRPVPALAPAA